MRGPGKYDDLCTMVREQAKADTAIVIVLDGDKGGGFSVQSADPDIMDHLPDILEFVVRQMRETAKE